MVRNGGQSAFGRGQFLDVFFLEPQLGHAVKGLVLARRMTGGHLFCQFSAERVHLDVAFDSGDARPEARVGFEPVFLEFLDRQLRPPPEAIDYLYHSRTPFRIFSSLFNPMEARPTFIGPS